MFPRDYFKRVGTVVGYFILTILALLGIMATLGIFRAKVDGEVIPEDLARENLWKCDCSDQGKHVDLDWHGSTCQYLCWYIDYQDKLRR